ncbi:MAG: hypothetical protein LWW85_11115, partial [Marinilabiliales bacterium]|nr:hypothetical protein [Marinilabiliales bacterium]
RATFRGGIRGKSNEPFMKLRSVQYNFMESPTRIFYIVARKMGIPACGVHLYKEEKAVMDIRMLGLIPLVYASGVEMDQSETVTFFNDMCVMAPGSLIDRRITWEETGPLSVEATYRNGRIAIRAQLLFDDSGKLRNFISTDRYETSDGKHYFNYPWQTPISEYVRIDGFLLPAKARLIYNHPDEELCYGEFELTGMQYNCREYF